MKNDSGGCPDSSCPNMTIWFPVLVVPLILGMGFLLYLRHQGFAIDAQSKKQNADSKLRAINEATS